VRYTKAIGSEPATFTVGNTPGVVLPATGGEGTRRLILMGILLIALAGAGLIMIRRRREMTR
jgi:LPXTG-motif cell wall-anchored protein